MTDPFYVFILMMNLGRGYIVWDKASSIDFVKPGKGTMYCRFELTKKEVDKIKAIADAEGKSLPILHVEIRNGADELIARVEKKVYIRKR